MQLILEDVLILVVSFLLYFIKIQGKLLIH